MRPTYKAIIAHCQLKDRRWRAHSEALRNRVARLDPRTDGHLGLAHNWGNDAARKAMRDAQSRWQKFQNWHDKRYHELARADVIACGGRPCF